MAEVCGEQANRKLHTRVGSTTVWVISSFTHILLSLHKTLLSVTRLINVFSLLDANVKLITEMSGRG